MPADPVRPDALDENAVEAIASVLMEQAWNVTATMRPDVRDKYRHAMREKVRAVLAHADLVPRADVEPTHLVDQECPWCEGTGWVCDGCNRPEALCMASECRGAALSMSGCPHCVISCLRAEVDRAVRERDEARGELADNQAVRDDAMRRAEQLRGALSKLRRRADVYQAIVRPNVHGWDIATVQRLRVQLQEPLLRALKDAHDALNDERRPGE